jgi:hypothetical protein
LAGKAQAVEALRAWPPRCHEAAVRLGTAWNDEGGGGIEFSRIPEQSFAELRLYGAGGLRYGAGRRHGVAVHCGPGKDNGFGGCTFMDMVELAVYGQKAP